MQVTRQRVAKAPLGLFRQRTGRRIRLVAAGTAALAIASGGISYASTRQFGTEHVGQITGKGQVVSSDQYIKPIGRRLVINNGKIMSSTVSGCTARRKTLTVTVWPGEAWGGSTR